MTDPGCYFHGEEPIPENCYLVCGECGHAWMEEELIAAHNQILSLFQYTEDDDEDYYEDYEGVTSADDIFCCPLCNHDF